MYSVWEFDDSKQSTSRPKNANADAHQERDRRSNATELVRTYMTEAISELPPISASETLSAMFRERGVPSLDSFTAMLVGAFRRSLGLDPVVTGLVRKFIVLTKWQSPNVTATLWTIEPVVPSLVVRGNSTDVRMAHEKFSEHLDWIEPMSMTSHMTIPKPDNEIRGRWAGWIVSMANQEQGWSDSVCSTCNVSSTLFAVTIHTKDSKMAHFAMTPESINIIGMYASNMAADLGVSVSLLSHTSTKLKIQPSISANRNTSLRLFGNGSMQFCGSPTDIEPLFSAAYKIVRRVMDVDSKSLLESMRMMRAPVI